MKAVLSSRAGVRSASKWRTRPFPNHPPRSTHTRTHTRARAHAHAHACARTLSLSLTCTHARAHALCCRADFDGYLLEDVGGGYLETSGGWATRAEPQHTNDDGEGVREGGEAGDNVGVEETKGEGQSAVQSPSQAQEGQEQAAEGEAMVHTDLGKTNKLSFDEAQWKRWNRTSWDPRIHVQNQIQIQIRIRIRIHALEIEPPPLPSATSHRCTDAHLSLLSNRRYAVGVSGDDGARGEGGRPGALPTRPPGSRAHVLGCTTNHRHKLWVRGNRGGRTFLLLYTEHAQGSAILVHGTAHSEWGVPPQSKNSNLCAWRHEVGWQCPTLRPRRRRFNAAAR